MCPDKAEHHHDKSKRVAVKDVLAVLPRSVFHVDDDNPRIDYIAEHVRSLPGCLPADTVQALDKQVRAMRHAPIFHRTQECAECPYLDIVPVERRHAEVLERQLPVQLHATRSTPCFGRIRLAFQRMAFGLFW